MNGLRRGAGIRARCGLRDAEGVVPFFFSRDSLQLWFRPRGGLRCDPPWRSWFSPCPIGPKIFFWRRCAAVRRSAPSACRTAMVSRPHSSHPQDGASLAHSSRARSAERVGAGVAQQTETAPINHCVGRRAPCYPYHHAGAARLHRDAITLCRRAPQSSPSRPSRPCQTEGAQLRVGVSA